MDTEPIIETISRYFAALDERDFRPETFHGIFTDDATNERPNGSVMTGADDIRASHEQSLARFKVT